MDCQEARGHINAFVDNELDERPREIFLAHITQCPSCAALVDDYQRIGEHLASGRHGGPDDLDTKIQARIAREAIARHENRTAARTTFARMAVTVLLACALSGLLFLIVAKYAEQRNLADSNDALIAQDLATMLRASMGVITRNQDKINTAELADKGLDGRKVLAESIADFLKQTGKDPTKSDPQSRGGRLLRAQMDAIVDVMDRNQSLINEQGKGFKGFIPSRFARLVNEEFSKRTRGESAMKTTAPLHLLRNKQATPDAWELDAINLKFLSPGWKEGEGFSEIITQDGHKSTRFVVPQYYRQPCLACHGEPKGSIDITGYPREGGRLGDVGGALSIIIRDAAGS